MALGVERPDRTGLPNTSCQRESVGPGFFEIATDCMWYITLRDRRSAVLDEMAKTAMVDQMKSLADNY